MNKITPNLWFDGQAEEAANFYCSIFPNSRVKTVTPIVVEFELDGNSFIGINGGPMYQFTEAISFAVDCQSKEEVDHYWDRLTADGGQPSRCGWLKDKYGVSWQIIPAAFKRMMSDPDGEKRNRVMQAMLQMQKLDVDALQRAFDGDPVSS
ncbi:MAG: VOC family protein [Acidobacteriota bacterium]|nr:VOC family protein [Acidobacteriota bacterium]